MKHLLGSTQLRSKECVCCYLTYIRECTSASQSACIHVDEAKGLLQHGLIVPNNLSSSMVLHFQGAFLYTKLGLEVASGLNFKDTVYMHTYSNLTF